MKFSFIDAKKAEFPINRMCKMLGVSQSGFHTWKDRPACYRQRQDIWCCSPTCGRRLSQGLLDEIVLSVVPVILGMGVRLFDRTPKPIDLTLQDVRQFDKGLVQLVYRAIA